MLFSMMKKAMLLPLACSSVIQKVVVLMKTWLMDLEVPPFLSRAWHGRPVHAERVHVLLSGFLFSFFRSPYIPGCGERHKTVLALSATILEIVRDLSALNRFSAAFWTAFLTEFCSTVRYCTRHLTDVLDADTQGLLVRVLLSSFVHIFVFSEVDLAPDTWDQLMRVFSTEPPPTPAVLQSVSESVV